MSVMNAFGSGSQGGYGTGVAVARDKETSLVPLGKKPPISEGTEPSSSAGPRANIGLNSKAAIDISLDTSQEARPKPSDGTPAGATFAPADNQTAERARPKDRAVNWAAVGEEYRHKAPVAAVSLSLRPGVVVRTFGIVVIPMFFAGLLVACFASYTGRAYGNGLMGLFSLDRAWTFVSPTFVSWFSSVCFFSCAVLLALLATVAKTCRDPLYKDWRALSWLVLAISADQICNIHLQILALPHRLFSYSGSFDVLWLVLAAVYLALRFKVFMRCLPRDTRKRLVLGSVLYFCGLLGMEIIGTAHEQAALMSGPYQVSTLIDQTLEMAGLLLFLRALLDHVAEYAPRFGLHFDRR